VLNDSDTKLTDIDNVLGDDNELKLCFLRSVRISVKRGLLNPSKLTVALLRGRPDRGEIPYPLTCKLRHCVLQWFNTKYKAGPVVAQFEDLLVWDAHLYFVLDHCKTH